MSLRTFLLNNPDRSEILETTYSMYSELEKFHKNGYYAEDINFDTITFSQLDGNRKRFDFGIMNTSADGSTYTNHCLENIRDLTYTSLGMFAYKYSSELQTSNPSFFDYSKISKQDPFFVTNNYNVIRDAIPYGNAYFDDIISGNYEYFNHFVDNEKKDSQSRNNSRGSYVKTTPFGKGYGEDDSNNLAYIKIWFYPIIILCAALIAFVTYILFAYL